MFLDGLVEKRENGTLFVDARRLHSYLKDGSTYKFTDWKKQYLLKDRYGFVENTDFVNVRKVTPIENTNLKQERIETELTIHAAKELCMLSGMSRGKEARDYFIKCEEELIQLKINAIKEVSMIFSHKDKLELTKNCLYPILEKKGVLPKSKRRVHELVKRSIIGKYENITMSKEFDVDEFVNDYKELVIKLKEEGYNYFVDENQITVFDLLEAM